MSRHRNIKSMDYDEEYEGYYSCYGHSVEEESCISPSTESQFLYDRNNTKQSVSSFLKFEPTIEVDEDTSDMNSINNFNHPLNGSYSNISEAEKEKVQLCVEAMQDVVGDTIPEMILIKAAIDNSCEVEKALNSVLSSSSSNHFENKDLGNVVEDLKFAKNQKYEKAMDLCEKNIEKLQIETNPSSEHSSIALSKIDSSNDENVNALNREDSTNCKNTINAINIVSKDEKQIEPGISSSGEKFRAMIKSNLNLFEKERGGNSKALLNLVVIGHVDAGKSTLMGHLLYNLGFVPKKAMHKYEQESKKLGKASFMYAWVLDETSEERNRGITMDVAQSKFESPNRIINLLDAPGHKDFIPNMIAGASQADVAILVVDATLGEFETGFEAGGQTREHTMLIRSLGVSQLAIAVNKMDNVNWDFKRYENITNKLITFLKQVGFKEKDVYFVPCSGLTGENLTEPLDVSCELKKWYNGPTLIDVIDGFKPPEREISKPLRMCVSDVFKGIGSGFCVSGRIESGCVRNGDKVLIMPAGEQAVVKAISINETPAQHSFAGDHVVIQLTSIDINNLCNGSIVCDPNIPVPVTYRFEARLVIFNISIPITKGFPVILHYQNLTEQAVIKKLVSQLHRSTGELIKKRPRCLTKNSSAIVEIEVLRPVCIELYKDFKELGRFMLRSAGSSIAAGLVTKIM